MSNQSPVSTPQESPDTDGGFNTAHMRRVLASSFIGSAIEFYDFILYAMAASIVFSEVFFTAMTPAVALFASFGTLAVGYVARPLGGALFGHFGDRLGRKTVLVVSMSLMGGGTAAIGLLPTTAQIGMAAPILLVLLRLIQGIAVGGEWGGAMLVAVEHSSTGRRGFAASFANMGGPAGAVLATVTVSAFTTLPHEAFMSWGWRLPFLLSLVLIAVGLAIRLKVVETPLFLQLERTAEKKKIPIAEVFTKYPRNWVLGVVAGMSSYTVQGLMTVWAVSYVINAGVDSTGVLNVKAVGATLTIIAIWFASRMSDKYGRRPVMLTGMIAGAVLAYPILWLLQTDTLLGFAIGLFLANGVIQGVIFGPFGAFVAELFPTRVRYTGASVTYQSASTLGAGFTPMVASGLVVLGGGDLFLVGVAWVLSFVVAGFCVLATKEGKNQDLADEMA
ncbi:MFS transporter [Haloactinomyces albus]|uniref:MFS family permease n=1 Tax=Haloactinomyces albus TaxID=1352928 RepID=A0AAE4CRE1_9ACTN|nr:MFS transporter [Haloactinomyces albus]MDR7303628.1 MFS family permease [Haloactinomyces albus]